MGITEKIQPQYGFLGGRDIFKRAINADPRSLAFRALVTGEAIAANAMRLMTEHRKSLGRVEEHVPGEWLTKADTEIQKMAIGAIREQFPKHSIIGEESFDDPLGSRADSRFKWVIDPIDGTAAFAKKRKNTAGPTVQLIPGFVQFGFQMSMLFKGMPQYSVFAAPVMDIDGSGYSIFETVKGLDGTFLNGNKIPRMGSPVLKGSTAIVSFAKNPDEEALRDHIRKSGIFGTIHERAICSGSEFALLTARPRSLSSFSLKITEQCRVWDLLTGADLVIKNGGRVIFIDGSQVFPFDFRKMSNDLRVKPVIAGSSANVERILEIIRHSGIKV